MEADSLHDGAGHREGSGASPRGAPHVLDEASERVRHLLMSETPDQPSPRASAHVRTDEPWTVERLLRWVSDDFRSRGLETPRLEAELLLCRALGWDRIRLIIERDRELDDDERARFRSLVQRRRKREPVAYIMGQREFFGRTFRVDERVLVPRPDTETLVETALRRTRDGYLRGRLVDLCTGSGCVALSFARERPTWEVRATDISPGALEVARDNAVRLGATWNVELLLGDLFEPLAGETFDAITANPPYIRSGEIATLSPDIRDHEPRLALDGGDDGLDIVRRIVRQAPSHLSEAGLLAMEIGCDQHAEVSELMRAAGFGQIEVDHDLAGHPRVVSGVFPR